VPLWREVAFRTPGAHTADRAGPPGQRSEEMAFRAGAQRFRRVIDGGGADLYTSPPFVGPCSWGVGEWACGPRRSAILKR
jgi:hypothetical protein